MFDQIYSAVKNMKSNRQRNTDIDFASTFNSLLISDHQMFFYFVLSDTQLRPHFIIFERSRGLKKVPEDWWKANIIPTFKKSKKNDLGNNRSVHLTSIHGKETKQIYTESISKHTEDKNVTGIIQHGFMKVKSCLTNLTAFYYET